MRFVQSGSVVFLEVQLGAFTHTLKFDTGAQWSADLLRSALAARSSDLFEAARREAYAQGWRDAKAKRRKQTWFSGHFQ